MKGMILILISVVYLIDMSAHPIKMTTGKINFNHKDHIFEITLNFFADDFENAMIEKYSNTVIDINNNNEYSKKILYDYISKNLIIYIDDIKIGYNIKSISSIDDNICQINIVSEKTNPFSKIEIKDILLFDVLKTQSNVLYFFYDNKLIEILKFIPGNAVQIIHFN